LLKKERFKMARKLKDGFSRRKVLKGAAGLGAAALGSGVIGAPTIWAQNIKNITLRQCGTGVSAFNEIADKAKAGEGKKESCRHRCMGFAFLPWRRQHRNEDQPLSQARRRLCDGHRLSEQRE